MRDDRPSLSRARYYFRNFETDHTREGFNPYGYASLTKWDFFKVRRLVCDTFPGRVATVRASGECEDGSF